MKNLFSSHLKDLLLFSLAIIGGSIGGCTAPARISSSPMFLSLTSSFPNNASIFPTKKPPDLTPTLTIAESPSPLGTTPFSTPVLLGTPYPKPAKPITSNSASETIQLTIWGRGTIYQAGWSPDNNTLAVSTSLGIYLYDPITLKENGFLSGLGALLFISPDGKSFATLGAGGHDIELRLLSNGSLLRTFGEGSGKVTNAVISPDGTMIAGSFFKSDVLDENIIYIWRITDEQPLLSLNTVAIVGSMIFSPDNKILSAATEWVSNGGRVFDDIYSWNIPDGKQLQGLQIQRADFEESTLILFSPNGRIFAYALSGGKITLYDLSSGKLLHTLFGNSEGIITVAFSPNGSYLASAYSDGTVRIWNPENGMLLRTIQGAIGNLSFSPDGALLLSADPTFGLRIYGVSNGELLHTLEWGSLNQAYIAFSRLGNILASSSGDNILLRQVSDGTLQSTLKGSSEDINSINFSTDGSLLAGTSWEATYIWRLSDGALLFTLSGYKGVTRSVSFSPDGSILASGAGDGIRFWNVADGTINQILNPVDRGVNAIAFSPGGNYFASASDSHLRIWHIPEESLLYTLDLYVGCVAFAPKGTLVAACSFGDSITLWNFSDGELQTWGGKSNNHANSLAFSPDGSLLAAGYDDGELCLWRVIDGRLAYSSGSTSASIISLAFSPDGTLLATGSEDGTVRLWGILQ